MSSGVTLILQFGIPLFLIVLGYTVGHIQERRHFRSLVERESAPGPTLSNLKTVPEGMKAVSGVLCTGNVVIASDYFKSFGAGLKTLVGGRLRTLETLLERGRREALQRMRTHAARMGADLVLNVRLETSVILRGKGNKASSAAEVYAYGTTVKLAPK